MVPAPVRHRCQQRLRARSCRQMVAAERVGVDTGKVALGGSVEHSLLCQDARYIIYCCYVPVVPGWYCTGSDMWTACPCVRTEQFLTANFGCTVQVITIMLVPLVVMTCVNMAVAGVVGNLTAGSLICRLVFGNFNLGTVPGTVLSREYTVRRDVSWSIVVVYICMPYPQRVPGSAIDIPKIKK